jgi:hypothetical protein
MLWAVHSEAVADADHGCSGRHARRNRLAVHDRLVHRARVVDVPDLHVGKGPLGQAVFGTHRECRG